MMKKITTIYGIMACVLLLQFTACSDFLDKQPIDAFTDENYWTSEANLRTFSWKFYSDFIGYGAGVGTTAEFYFQNAPANGCINFSDDLASATYLAYQQTASTTNTEWKNYYTSVRRANLMFSRVDDVPGLNSESYKHWKGVARFFRAYNYFKLVQRFGNIPYTESYLQSDDAYNIYKPSTDRNTVMDNVKEDLEQAVSLLRTQDEFNTINKYTALALLSRVCLFEGTYRKYHAKGDGKKFLERAKSASDEIMSGSYQLGYDFQSTYNSIELKNNKEMILYVDYQVNVYANSIQSYTNTSSIINGMTKAAVDSYVCNDGQPILQSDKYSGDQSYESIIKNRDKRMLAALHLRKLGYADNTTDDGLSSSTGYVIALYNNPAIPLRSDVTSNGRNYIDAPIFGLAEVLLNYAEACAELGTITQPDLDKSINLLRDRAGIARLTYVSADNVKANLVTIDDPRRTSALEQISGVVPSIIWEIRRERRAELMTWTYMRYYDLMRWKKGEYLDTKKNPDVALGAYIGEATDKVKVNDKGYILVYPTFTREFNPNKHYFNSIPLNDIILYKNEGVELKQNEGWK